MATPIAKVVQIGGLGKSTLPKLNITAPMPAGASLPARSASGGAAGGSTSVPPRGGSGSSSPKK